MKENRRAWLDILLSPNIEGGYVNNPDDPGGATNMGITAQTLGEWRKLGRAATPDEVRMVTRDDAEGIALARYWNAMRCDQLPAGVDIYAADFAFNSGPGNAAEILQRLTPVEKVDGFIGDLTIAAVRQVNPAKLLESYHNSRMAFLRGLTLWPKFGNGWASRCDQLHELAKGKLEANPGIAEAAGSKIVVANTAAGGLSAGGILWAVNEYGPLVLKWLQEPDNIAKLQTGATYVGNSGLPVAVMVLVGLLTMSLGVNGYSAWRRIKMFRKGAV